MREIAVHVNPQTVKLAESGIGRVDVQRPVVIDRIVNADRCDVVDRGHARRDAVLEYVDDVKEIAQ